MAKYFLILLIFIALTGLVSWFLMPRTWSRFLLWAGRKAVGLQSKTIMAGHINWHYLRGGRGRFLVAIHGFGADADHWQRVAPQLRSRFEIIAPDLIGFGSSHQGNELQFSINDQVDRLAALLDLLEVDSCVMAGSSMGGWIASRFAQRYPEKVKGLWLLAPLGVRDCEPGELLKKIGTGQESPLAVASVRDFERLVFRPMFARQPHLPHPLKMHYGQRAVRRSRASQRMFSQVHASEPALESILASLNTPILVQWGTEDRAVHVSGADRLQREICTGEIIIQSGVGHLPMLEAPGLTAGQFLKFATAHGLTLSRSD